MTFARNFESKHNISINVIVTLRSYASCPGHHVSHYIIISLFV